MKIFLSCIPPKATHQASARILKRRDGTSFVGKMQNSKGKAVQRDLLALLHPHAPAQPFEGPLKVKVAWCYPWRKSEPKKNRLAGSKPCDTRPDVDNLAKMFLDICSRLFWVDDSQISSLTFSKWWGDHPGIALEILEMGKDTQPTNDGQEPPAATTAAPEHKPTMTNE